LSETINIDSQNNSILFHSILPKPFIQTLILPNTPLQDQFSNRNETSVTPEKSSNLNQSKTGNFKIL
jgi:hypothetical protein